MSDLSAVEPTPLASSTDNAPVVVPARQRLLWLDAARGVGIVFVVMGHVGSGLHDAGLATGAGWTWLDYSIYSFHMPLFFLIAGVNIPASLRRGRAGFIQAKLWNLAYPYVLWSLIQGAALIEMSRFTNGHANWSDLLTIGWNPMAQFWFLYALFLSQLVAMVLRPYPRATLVVAVVALLVLQMPMAIIDERFIQGLAFTLIGMRASEAIIGWQPARPLVLGGAFIGLFGLLLPVTGWLSGFNYYVVATWPSTVAGVAAVLTLSRLVHDERSILAALGRASMTIYVLHIFAAAGTRIMLQRLHVTSSAEVIFIVATIVGVIAPFAIHQLLQRFNLLWPLGLASLPRRTA